MAGRFGKLFTGGSLYRAFRPTYPQQLLDKILTFGGWKSGSTTPRHDLAIDVGCGTGQVTVDLANYFDRVVGVDSSVQQLESAEKRDNVTYHEGTAERTGEESGSADLVTAAQAAHWFDMPKFYAEASRVLRPGGVLAIWGYSLMYLPESAEGTDLIKEYHGVTLGKYWEKERKLVDDGYPHIDMPYPRKEKHLLDMEKKMSISALVSYLSTFSALKTFKEQRPGEDPLAEIEPKLIAAFKAADNNHEVEVRWPLFLYLGQRE